MIIGENESSVGKVETPKRKSHPRAAWIVQEEFLLGDPCA